MKSCVPLVPAHATYIASGESAIKYRCRTWSPETLSAFVVIKLSGNAFFNLANDPRTSPSRPTHSHNTAAVRTSLARSGVVT